MSEEGLAGMTWWKLLPKSRRLLPIALLVLVFSNVYLGIWGFTAAKADSVQMSPGKILPQGYNHYLNTSDVQVKLEYSKAIILQETMGDLLFNITTRRSKRTIALYLPPEFGITSDLRYVWTSVTNDYRSISLSRLSDRDPIAPNWWRILVSGSISNRTGNVIRVFNVTAPSIVGRYFFKVFTDGASIGATNFPTLVVSAAINPAYISGTVLDGSRDPSRYGHPIQLEDSQGGKVVAVGVTPQGRIVIAQAFFNASAAGRYTLYGLAPGTYHLTATAAAYCNSTRPEPVSVLAGQSFDGADVFAYPSPKLEGIVWSKCSGLLEPWGPIVVYPAPGDGAALAYGGQDLIYALRGVSTSNFLEYDASAKKWQFFPASTPGSVGPGGALAFDGSTYIYALEGGGSNAFWSYNTISNQPQGVWQAKTPTPSPIGDGGALAFSNNLIYALRGGGTTDFWSYDPNPSINRWTPLTSTPAAVNAGGSLTFNPNDNKLYALFGSTTDFWRYKDGNWEPLANAPNLVGAGGALAFDGVRYIYALRGGGNPDFWKYDPTSNIWTDLTGTAPTPASVDGGGSLTFNTNDGKLYALGGGGTRNFWRYDPDPINTWTALSIFPLTYPRPITIEVLDSLGDSERLLQNFTDPASDRFDFSYDGSAELDGHIPQDGSGYVSGISPGLHIVEVWVNQYFQPDVIQLPSTNTQITGIQVQLPSYEARTRIQLDVQRTGLAEILVHFKNFAYLLNDTPVETTKTLTVELYDHNRVLRAQNSTRVPAGNSSNLVSLTGFLGTLRDYGLPTDTYIIGVTVQDDSYYLPSDSFVTIGDCNGVAQVSLQLIRTGSLKVTIRSVDSQMPPQPKNWTYPGAPIKMEIRDQYGVAIAVSNSTRQRPDPRHSQNVSVSVTGLSTGLYSIYVFTFGYIQVTSYRVFVMDGATSDTVVNIVQGGRIDLTVVLEKEDMFTTIDTYPFSSRVPIRIQVLDAQDRFVAANVTSVSSTASVFNFTLAGFQSYAGDYIDWRWVNYYDTTDGAFRTDYGLGPGAYTFIVFLPGFAQSETFVTAEIPKDGTSSVILHLNRLAHFSGHVISFNMFNELVPLNWATVDAIGEKTHDFTSTLDGSFDMWLEEGHYLVICSLDGYEFATRDVYLPKGSDIPIDLYLQPLQS